MALEENASYIRCGSADKSVVNVLLTAFATALVMATCNIHRFYRGALYLWQKKKVEEKRDQWMPVAIYRGAKESELAALSTHTTYFSTV